MYLHHTIVPGGLANTTLDGTTIGFSVQVRIGFPRGVPLSLVEGFELTVGEGTAVRHFGREQINFRLRDRSYRPEELVDVVDRRWEMGEIATLELVSAGGLPPGPHRITVTQFLRVGATPQAAQTIGTRTVELRSDHQVPTSIAVGPGEPGPTAEQRGEQ